MLLLLVATRALAWPASDADWLALTQGGADLVDVVDDHDRDGLGNPDGIDCVGDASIGAPALYWQTDGTDLFLRMRVDDTPWLVEGTFLQPLDWSILLDTDGNLADYEYVLALTGSSPVVYFYRNTDGGDGADELADDLIDVNTTQWSVGEAPTSIHTLGDWFIDVSVDLGELPSSFLSGTTFRVAGITGNSSTPLGADDDLCATDDSAGLGALADAWSDSLGIDQDADALMDVEELELGTAVDDADSDDDGLTDGEEVILHATDPLECDSDGDTLSDGLELGVSEPHEDTDVGAGCFVPDGDAGATITEANNVDTDEGGLSDPTEDRDQDGVQDPWETDPTDPADDVDADGDGIPDALEDECGGGDGTDRDGDGRADTDELFLDTDGDGIPDFCDDDDDGDGLATVDEPEGDADGDGLDNWEDPDSDNNGVDDGDEPDGDSDCDGIIDAADLEDGDGPCADADGDGITNHDESVCGSNPADADSDGDGLLDGEESCDDDADCDELPDRLDAETDPDGCGDPIDTAPYDTAPVCADGLCGGHYTGGACSTGGGWASGLGVLVAGALAVRRRRARTTGALALGALAVAAAPLPARAEPTVNAQRYSPDFTAPTFFSVRDVRPHAPGFGFGLGVNYASAPLQYRFDDAREPIDLVGSATSLDLGVSFATGRLGVAVDMPLHLVSGDLTDGGFAPGDLRVSVLGAIIPRHDAMFGLGVYGDIGVPTGDGALYMGSGSPELSAGLSATVGKRVLVAANAGIHIASPAALDDLSWGSRAEWGVGVSVPVVDAFAIVAELEGESVLSTTDTTGANPIEWRLGGRARLGPNLVASLGGGTGLTTGVGAPEFRVLGGLGFVPAAREARVDRGPDRDGDGIADGQDLCPDQPEDRNGQADEDGCPDAGLVPTHLVVTDPEGRRLAGASIELVSGPELGRWSLPDGDLTRSLAPGEYGVRVRAPRFGATEARLVVPEAPRHEQSFQLQPAVAGGTVILSVRNEVGQPVSALVTLLGEGRKFTTGGDGIGTEPVPAGEVELSVWAEGYRPERVKVQVGKDEKKSVDVTLGVSRVVVLADRVDIRDKVFFDLDSATIKAESFRILDDVAATLENHTELRLVEVQGHTDDQGAEDYNLQLSQKRAEAVRKYLIGQGIEPDRLVARGYGEGQPLQPGTGEDAREVNRRVVFRILAGPPVDAPRGDGPKKGPRRKD